MRLDDNGKMVLDWMVDFSMIMLNDDFNCKGETTWQRGEQRIVVDFVLISKQAYQYFRRMEIDEHI